MKLPWATQELRDCFDTLAHIGCERSIAGLAAVVHQETRTHQFATVVDTRSASGLSAQ